MLKPPSNTPVTGGLIFAKIFEEAGLPPGVLSVVAGPACEIGDAFVSHPIPRVITFTGSTKAGRHIGELAMTSPIMKRASLELGGNSPLVVLDDADLELAVNAAVFGKFLNSGQICMSLTLPTLPSAEGGDSVLYVRICPTRFSPSSVLIPTPESVCSGLPIPTLFCKIQNIYRCIQISLQFASTITLMGTS